MVNCESLYSKFDRGNRVYAKTKKKKTLEELEIIPICSKKRVCEKNRFGRNFRNLCIDLVK